MRNKEDVLTTNLVYELYVTTCAQHKINISKKRIFVLDAASVLKFVERTQTIVAPLMLNCDPPTLSLHVGCYSRLGCLK